MKAYFLESGEWFASLEEAFEDFRGSFGKEPKAYVEIEFPDEWSAEDIDSFVASDTLFFYPNIFPRRLVAV